MYLKTGDALAAYRKWYDPDNAKSDEQATDEARKMLLSRNGREFMKAARRNAERAASRAITDRIHAENRRKKLAGNDRLVTATAMGALEDYALNKATLAQKLWRLASISLKDVATWDENTLTVIPSAELSDATAYGIVEIKHDGKKVSVKIGDRRQAIVDLANLMGMRADDDKPPPAESEARRKQAREAIMAMLTDLAQDKPLTINAAAAEAQVVPEDPEEKMP
jgi:hypothetical protein